MLSSTEAEGGMQRKLAGLARDVALTKIKRLALPQA